MVLGKGFAEALDPEIGEKKRMTPNECETFAFCPEPFQPLFSIAYIIMIIVDP